MSTRCFELLTDQQVTIVNALKSQASSLLDCNPRFRYFTLHGRQHIENLFALVEILIEGGLQLKQEQAFLLAGAICVHDLGMVLPLSEKNHLEIFGGKPQPIDPANLELMIRTFHHKLIDNYVANHFDFLLSLGLNAPQCAMLRDISRSHRKVDLDKTEGFVRSIGALLRVIDELDVYPSRAPAIALLNNYQDMDGTSCWHWFKHNICHGWSIGHNVVFRKEMLPRITFKISVHPSRAASIPYWLNQIRRPIYRVFFDEGAHRIILDTWGLHVNIETSQQLSSATDLGANWGKVEQKALSAGRKIIMVIDDEVRKMEDLFLPLMQDYHVIFAPNARDGLDKLNAATIDFVIVDLQVGSGFSWSPEETLDYKMTGVRLCKEIQAKFPGVKIGILTGSRYDLSNAKSIQGLEFLTQKPVDPEEFEKAVRRVLG